MDNRDAKRKRPITCLESGVTYDSAYRAAKELGFADSRNIFRSIQRGTCTQGLHFYYADEPSRHRSSSSRPTGRRAPWYASIPGRRSNRHSRRAARSASRPEACALRPARASSAAVCTSVTATSRSPRLSSLGSAIRKPVPSSAWKPARPSWAIRRRPVPCMYRPPRSARPSATDRPSTGSISTMGTSRSRRRSSSSRRRSKAARAPRRWRPRQGPPRGARVAWTLANGSGVRYNRCGR